MKTDKDGNDMRGVTVNRFAEGKKMIVKVIVVINFIKTTI